MRAPRWVTVLAISAVSVALAAPAMAAPPKKTPTPVITSKPAAFVNVTTATFVFTNTLATAVHTCSLDGAKATTCTSPVSYTGLKVGAHTFTVKATAPGYKPSGSAVASWTIDQTAPSAPTVTQPASPNKLSTVPVTFSSTATDLNNFTCSLDGAAATTCTSPYNANVTVDGAHSVAVRAVDKAGNVSAARTVSWLRDTVVSKPVVTSGPPSLTTATSATFTFSSDEVGTTLTCKLDSGAFVACPGGTVTYPGPLSSSVGGVLHTFTVRATDAATNVATSDVFSWTVKNAVPVVVTWTNPGGLPTSPTSSTGGTFAFSVTGATTVTCSLDGVVQGTCTSPESVAGLGEGNHTYAVSGTGGLPTQTVTLTYGWTVDTTDPGVPTIDGPSGTVGTSSADITVTAAEAGTDLDCTVDGVITACTAPFSLSGLSEGDHTVDAVATDAAGNTATSSLTWTVDTVGPVATVTTPTSLVSPVTVAFDEDVSGVASDSVVLQVAAGAVVPATLTCTDSLTASVDCAIGPVASVAVSPTSHLVPGQSYELVVNPAAAPSIVDAVGNAATETTTAFRGSLVEQETSVAATATWSTVKNRKAKGRSYLVERRKGASVSWSFSGRSVGWITVTGPTFGLADVFVDGVRKATVNNYAASTKYGVVRTVKGLSAGSHTVKVVAKGKKGNKRGKDTRVAVDGFKVGTKVTATPKVRATWQRVTSSKAFLNGYSTAGLKGQAISFSFRGTGVKWATVTGPSYGIATVLVDGVKVASVDNYSKATKYKVFRNVSGLSDGLHTLRLVVSGAKRKGAKGISLAIDGWVVT